MMKTILPYKPYRGVTLYKYEYTLPHDHWTVCEGVYEKDGHNVRTFVDFSHYQEFTEEMFHMWVDLGMPDRTDIRGTNGPLHPEDLIIEHHRRKTGI